MSVETDGVATTTDAGEKAINKAQSASRRFICAILLTLPRLGARDAPFECSCQLDHECLIGPSAIAPYGFARRRHRSTQPEIFPHPVGADIGGIDIAHRVSRNTGRRSAGP